MVQIIVIIVVIIAAYAICSYFFEEHPIIVIVGGVLLFGVITKKWNIIAGIIITGAVLISVIYVVNNICSAIKESGQKRENAAKIVSDTQHKNMLSNNYAALSKELSLNCRWLGYMDAESWSKKLPNFANKEYSESFETITENFAKQMEEENITQNDEWFKPFITYIVEHSSGSTVTKMLEEVRCPQFGITHCTNDRTLLENMLEFKTKPVSKDVPALFKKVPLDIGEALYLPTKYAKKLYGSGGESNVSHHEVIDLDAEEV